MDFWSVLYTVVLYSTLTLVGVLVFYAINRVAQATWDTDLYPNKAIVTTHRGALTRCIIGYKSVAQVACATLLIA